MQKHHRVNGLAPRPLLDAQCREWTVRRHVVGPELLDPAQQLPGDLHRLLVEARLHSPGAVDPRAGVDELHFRARQLEQRPAAGLGVDAATRTTLHSCELQHFVGNLPQAVVRKAFSGPKRREARVL